LCVTQYVCIIDNTFTDLRATIIKLKKTVLKTYNILFMILALGMQKVGGRFFKTVALPLNNSEQTVGAGQ